MNILLIIINYGCDIMPKIFKEFYDALTENLDSYNGQYASFIDNGPKLYKLLSNLLMNYNKKLDSEDKMKINAAISYYVVPLDVIPESEYGPYGYIDDIYICVYVIKDLIEKYGYEEINQFWEEIDDLSEVVNESYEKTTILLDDTDEILEYIGLI